MAFSIKGLNKAAVLAVLYNASKPQGMGFMKYDPKPMSVEEAQCELDSNPSKYFDYLKGRVMKISLAKDEVDTWGYNRDNGNNAAEKAIKIFQEEGNPNAKSIQDIHGKGTLSAVARVEENLDTPTTMKDGVLQLGLSDVKGSLKPAIEKITLRRN